MQVPQTVVILRSGETELARATLPPGEYVIGRSPEVEIFANTPLISRRHAQLTINYDHLLLEDLGSSNGTFVAEERITEPTRLFPNQHVRLGDIVLEVHRERAPISADMSLAPAQAAIRRLLPEELLSQKRYAIGSQVARGGMGAIMMARQETTQRNVAMKVMLQSGDEADVMRFVEEAQITSQLEDPNIVPIYELGVDEQEQLFYTMKFVRGITLKKVLELLDQRIPETVKKFPLSALLTIFQKTCDALAFAHSKGVIHRDLKPENLMLGDFGEVLVMDWGLAKVLGQEARPASDATRSSIASARTQHTDSSRTMMGSIMGTPQYMSPEQARGEVEWLDARSDVYSLGAILFEIIYLRAPVSGSDATEVVDKVAQGMVEWDAAISHLRQKTWGGKQPLSHLPDGRPPDSLVAVCRKALAWDPAQRYASVADLQRDLTAYQTGFATSAESAGAWKQFRLLIRRNRGVSTAIAAALIIVAAVTSIFTINVVRARNRAETTLLELRGTAPTFAAQSRTLVEEGKLDEALEKIAYATQLDPKNADYLLQRGNYLQIALRLHEAIATYKKVLEARPGDAVAQQNLDLCMQLLAGNGGKDELPQPLVIKLVDALLAQGRQIEANPLAQRVGKGSSTSQSALLARLKTITAQPNWNSSRLHFQSNGTLFLSLNSLHVTDLTALRGFPISSLDVDDPNFTDLAPLAELPLTHLGLYNTGVSDLAPLAHLPLEYLNLNHTRVTDFSPLRGLKLRDLNLYQLNLTDLKFVTGMRLERLDLSTNKVTDIEPLRGMPIRDLNLSSNHIADLSPLSGMPLESLSIPNMDFSEFPSLKGLPLHSLSVGGNRISDLSPLAGLKLTSLTIAGNPFTDLSALRGMPLKFLDLGMDYHAIDLAPLADCKDLEEITLPKYFLHEEVLKKLPNLHRARIGSYQSFSLPTRQFWAEMKPEWLGAAHARAIIEFSKVKHHAQTPVSIDAQGTVGVDLAGTESGSIPSLSGLPLARFSCEGAAFTDLSPLRGLPLRRVDINGSKIADLGPIHGMTLQYLSLSGTPVTDLSPARGMPLQYINISGSKIHDLSPLHGMPLQEISAAGIGLNDLSFLRSLALHRLDINNNPATDISVLAGMPLESLNAGGTAIADLTPLRGMPLQYLNISRTKVRDFTPLRGLPITELVADSTPAQDFSPLLDLPNLEKLRIGGNAQQIAVLRNHPTLKYLTQGYSGAYYQVSEFWAAYDAKQAGKK